MPFADTGLAAGPVRLHEQRRASIDGPGGPDDDDAHRTVSVRIVDAMRRDQSRARRRASSISAASTGSNDCVSGSGFAWDTPRRPPTSFYEIDKLVESAPRLAPLERLAAGAAARQRQHQRGPAAPRYSPTLRDPRASIVREAAAGTQARSPASSTTSGGTAWTTTTRRGVLSQLDGSVRRHCGDLPPLRTSCVGYGFFATVNSGCGTTSDGTGFNANEAQVGASHCDLTARASVTRDWDRHADHARHAARLRLRALRHWHRALRSSDPLRRGAVDAGRRGTSPRATCRRRPSASHPSAPSSSRTGSSTREAATSAPWHACTCGGARPSGCSAANAYMNWLAADDDNGNILDGTPHMTAAVLAPSTVTGSRAHAPSLPSTAAVRRTFRRAGRERCFREATR